MIKKNMLLITVICFIGFNIWLATRLLTQKKIAYVRSSELVNKYEGMQEARNTYEDKTKLWQTNIDTLEADLQRAVSKYNTEISKLSPKEKTEQELYLKKQQQNLIQYSEAIRAKAKQEDDKITQGVLNQINSFVEEYGKQKGYDIIMGTTMSGSILYGKEELDITKEVLDGLNKSYKRKADEKK